MSSASTRAVSRWTVRTIPVVLTGCVGFATWVIVGPICNDYFIRAKGEARIAVAFLVLYFVFFATMLLAYLRTILTIAFKPGVTALGPKAAQRRDNEKRRGSSQDGVLESQPYTPGSDDDPDSPGLELFYTKDVFACETDGRPRWCSECCNWKPDRTHHSSEINRCVRKMDHFCPWVGGIISETSFKFFVQLTFWAACYCGLSLGAAGYCLHRQIKDALPANGPVIALLALGGFFGLFTSMMTVTSGRFIFLNLTNVDILRHKTRVYQLAIRVPRDTPASSRYGLITYPLPKPGQPTAGGHVSGHGVVRHGETAPRDLLANRMFAIVKTEMGENPWDLGWYGNWVSIMGTNPIDWFLPFNYSPCVTFESSESFYPMGPVYHSLRDRYGIDTASDDKDAIELRELNGRRERRRDAQ